MAKKSDVTVTREYLKERHKEIYGIDYVTRSHAMEGRLLKSMLAEYGADVVKRFIDACFGEYRPTAQYPGLNFAFMYSYMRERILSRVLAEKAKEEKRSQLREQAVTMTDDELTDWL